MTPLPSKPILLLVVVDTFFAQGEMIFLRCMNFILLCLDALYIQVDKPYGDVKDEFIWAQAWYVLCNTMSSYCMYLQSLK